MCQRQQHQNAIIMKTLLSFRWLLVLPGLCFVINSCSDKCVVKNTYTYYVPVYSTSAEIKAAVSFNSPQPIAYAGKIYFKDHILFINEISKGIHIIDNHDPSNPIPLGFLNIPGNFDLAIIDNTLYADSFVDLVAFDISDLSSIKEIKRVESLFNHYSSMGYYPNNDKGMVTDWKAVEKVSVEESECASQLQSWGGIYYGGGVALNDMATANFSVKSAVTPAGSTGIGGSMARFTIVDHTLYAIDEMNMDIVDISTPTNPISKTEVPLGWQPETLFPNKGNLFVGTRAGMYIYDLATPESPVLLSKYEHIESCDPVVVEGDYAYVTLYTGSICHFDTNELQVISLKDLANPTLVKKYPMTNPHGLGIDNGTLFICDGTDGLKVYDASDVNTIQDNLLAHYGDINAVDIIPFENIAMMISADGLYQYDYSDLKNIKLLSKIAVAP